MNQSTYNPCLLYTTDLGFGIVRLQTDNSLFIGDNNFVDTKQEKLKFQAKDWEMLTPNNPIKFNGGQIKLDNNSILLT